MDNKIFTQLLESLHSDLTILPDKPEESAVATLKALWFAACGDAKSVQEAAEHLELPALDSSQKSELEQLVKKRLQGVPLAHITGRQQFMGIELLVDAGALIPRKETELLGNTALKLIKQILQEQPSVTVIDVCTGAGNLPIAYATHEPSCSVFAADLSLEAVDLAGRNVDFHCLQDRVEIRQGDLLAPFDSEHFHGKVDVLTCNPPYISSSKVDVMHQEISEHEPRLAFDGGPFGIKIVHSLIQQAPKFLKQGGSLVFEVGLGQGPALMRRVKSNPAYKDVQGVADSNGDIRVIVGQV